MIGGPMKSLFKSGARDLKSRFSKKNADDELDTPLGLRIGAAVDIDTLPFRMRASTMKLTVPDETILIAAQGFIDLGDDSYVHRYYTEDDTMIQVLTINGTESQHVQEITLYTPYESHYPNTSEEWADWTAEGGRLGAQTFVISDGTEYARVWFDSTDPHAEPVEFTEFVYDDPDSDECVENYQQVMLFGRDLGSEHRNQYLLAIVDSYEGERTVELMTGVDLELAQLKVI